LRIKIRLLTPAARSLESAFAVYWLTREFVKMREIRGAAHKAVSAASESLVMDEMSIHVVIADVRQSDLPHVSSAVNVPSEAGLARFRAAALSECCRFVTRPHASRSVEMNGCRAPHEWAKAKPGTRARRLATWNHRSKDSGTEPSIDRVNWGTSARLERAVGINKKPTAANRSSDVVIVSNEADGQHNRWRSQGPLGRCVASEAVSAAGCKSDYGIQRARTRKPLWGRQSRREGTKGASDSLLEAVLGKTHRTEF